MTNQSLPVVLIIDDSPIDIAFLVETLSEHYAIIIANDGNMGLESARQRHPDAILMDVSMPALDGYETCRRLKQQEDTQNIDVIFVSAHESLEEKIAGYDAGGSDYIVKPVTPAELLQKVRVAVENKKQRESLQAHTDRVFSSTMTALSAAGELSVIIDFVRTASVTRSVSELSSYLHRAIEQYQLNSTVKIKFSKGDILYSGAQPVSALEKELMDGLQNTDQLPDRDQRAFFSEGLVSVLVQNMPEDLETKARFSNYIQTLLRETELYLQQIEAEIRLNTLISEAQLAILEANQEQEQLKQTSQDLFDNLLNDIHKAFDEWGMTESQEKLLTDIVNRAMEDFLQCYETGIHSDDKLKAVVDKLSTLAN